jgi:two-component system response regulator ChvI
MAAPEENATDKCIVIVDDDDLFRESVTENLREAGYLVVGFDRGPKFLEFMRKEQGIDLILLDWKMPDMNGIEVLRTLRKDGFEVPVIFLTVLSDQVYEEAALTTGAVDFVEKSRSFSILLKRIQLIEGGARGGAPAGETLETGPQTLGALRLDGQRAFWREHQVDLSLTEYRIVSMLAQKANKDVSYREIYDLVHGEGFVAGAGEDGYRANVRTFIKRIRQKFRDLDDTFDRIENYPSYGYRWATGADDA